MGITIEKAIGILELNTKVADEKISTDFLKAVKLGLSALKYFQKLRDIEHYIGMPLLEGETED